jgi:hypothetical protein
MRCHTINTAPVMESTGFWQLCTAPGIFVPLVHSALCSTLDLNRVICEAAILHTGLSSASIPNLA